MVTAPINREQMIDEIQENLKELNIDALKHLNGFVLYIKGEELYREDTKPERLEEIKAANTAKYEEENAKREAAKEERERFQTVNLYERNDTMKIIGHSGHLMLIAPESIYSNGFRDILQAHKYEDIKFETAANFFIYGVMCGIKEQRRKRQSRNRRGEHC